VIDLKEESGRMRNVSIRDIRDNPAENTVIKTEKDLLNKLNLKIENQSEIIDKKNLIDEPAALNENLNSVCIQKLYYLNVI
jgi:hypothetical protein